MVWARWVIVILGVLTGGWMLFDGTRALVVGDYVTPASGRYAGELGPWSRVVSAAGIEPRSTAIKAAFVIFGLTWLILILAFVLSAGWSWMGLLIVALATTWYLPIGTVAAVLIVVLLFLPSVRGPV